MAREATLSELVETIADAATALEKWSSAMDGPRTLSAARRIASASASIVARLKGFDDAELAGWMAAVDRAVDQHERARRET